MYLFKTPPCLDCVFTAEKGRVRIPAPPVLGNGEVRKITDVKPNESPGRVTVGLVDQRIETSDITVVLSRV